MQTFQYFLEQYHASSCIPLIVIMLTIGGLGNMINWIISPAKGLLIAAQHGFLPHYLLNTNAHGVAPRILIIQAICVTLTCLVFLILPNSNAIYWLFTSLSTEIYIMMYIVMFAAAIFLRLNNKNRKLNILNNQYYYIACVIGLLGCITTFIIGFFPPETALQLSNSKAFLATFITGLIITVLPAIILCHRNKHKI
jgi:amino acid transporter